MKLTSSYRALGTLLPACLVLLACGGGGGGGGSDTAYVESSSASFSPTTAKAANGQNVALHWTYAVNNGRPVMADLLGVNVGITVDALEVTLDPAQLTRQVRYQGPVSASLGGTAYSGNYAASVDESLRVSAGKTTIEKMAIGVDLSLAGGGESGTGTLTATVDGFTPAYEWFLDRENLDQLPLGQAETVTSRASADFRITATGETPITRSNLPVTLSDRWAVLEKLPTLVVHGKSYSNVVKLSRITQVPSFSGELTPVTMTFWVAKGIGMIKGQGIYRVLNVDNVTYELTQTNLVQK